MSGVSHFESRVCNLNIYLSIACFVLRLLCTFGRTEVLETNISKPFTLGGGAYITNVM